MAIDHDNFLHSLCRFLATAASLEYLGTPRALWRQQVNESDLTIVASPFSVVRVYPGPALNWSGLPAVALQVDTRSESPAGALARAVKLFEALCDAEGNPLHMQTINGYRASDNGADGTWRIANVELLQRPGSVGVDEKRRQIVVFNAEIAFMKLT